MDVAATAQYSREALKLKGEKASLLPASCIYSQEDDVKAEGTRLTSIDLIKKINSKKTYFYCSWKYCTCVLIYHLSIGRARNSAAQMKPIHKLHSSPQQKPQMFSGEVEEQHNSGGACL